MSRRMTHSSRKLLTWIPLGAMAAATACTPHSREPVTAQPDKIVQPAAVHTAQGPTRLDMREQVQYASFQLSEAMQQTGAEAKQNAERAQQERLRARQQAAQARQRAVAQARGQAQPSPGGTLLASIVEDKAPSQAETQPAQVNKQPVKLACRLGNSKAPNYGNCAQAAVGAGK